MITTNSLRQTFNRRVLERHLCGGEAVAITSLFAIPDHPWVDSADGAAVRIAMTVGAAERRAGRSLLAVERERRAKTARAVVLRRAPRRGEVHADLTIGADVGGAQRLQANEGLCFQGVKLVGKGSGSRRKSRRRSDTGSDACRRH